MNAWIFSHARTQTQRSFDPYLILPLDQPNTTEQPLDNADVNVIVGVEMWILSKEISPIESV